MKILTAVFTLSFVLGSIAWGLKTENEKVQIIIDVVKSFVRPTGVTAFLCWKPCIKAKLMIKLGTLNRPISIRFMNKHVGKSAVLLPTDEMIVVDLNCPFFEGILKMADRGEMFNSPRRWLIFDKIISKINQNMVPDALIDANIALNSEVIVVQKSLEHSLKMFVVYKVSANREWRTEFYGLWSFKGLQKSENMNTAPSLRRKNLGTIPIAVTFNINDKEIGFDLKDCDTKIHNSRHSVTRWGIHQIMVLYDFVNATRVNIFTDDWGYFINGSWNGIIGNMVRREVDLSGTPIFISKQRIEFAEYLINPVQTLVKFVFREPPLSYQNNLFLLPFNKAVWYSLIGFVLLLMLVIYMSTRWEIKKLEILDQDDKRLISHITVSDIALMIVGAISQQGTFVQLRGSIGRLVMFTLFLVFLFLFTAYSASIVVLLQSSSKQIRTLSDLLNSRLELGVEDTSYNIHYFTTATEPVRKAIYETKVAPRGSKPKFMSLEEGVKLLQRHPFAFNMDVGVGYRAVEKYFYEHEKCGLQEIAYVPLQKPWLTCRKGSPYAELFKIGIREHGMGDRANNLVYSKKPICAVRGSNFDSVSIIDAYPPLLLLLYGILLALALFLAEIFVHRRQLKILEKKHCDKEADTASITSPSS